MSIPSLTVDDDNVTSKTKSSKRNMSLENFKKSEKAFSEKPEFNSNMENIIFSQN